MWMLTSFASLKELNMSFLALRTPQQNGVVEKKENGVL